MTAPILLVEDNAATRKMLRIALQAEGYAVLEAENGKSALRMASECALGLVLIDCRLPDLDGFEVARRMHEAAPSVPLVAVTGWAQFEEGGQLTAAGFSDVVVKPVEPSRLIEIVSRYVHQPAPPSTAPTRKKVLVVDDDPAQRKLAQLALASAGLGVLAAEDGEIALRLASEHLPDVIVSDVLMPKMDGFQLCNAVRSDPALAGVPIVLTSAHYVEDEDRALAARFGANRYVTRSTGFDAVVQAVLEAIESPEPSVAGPPAEDRQSEYLHRIAHQLERQATIGAGLARRASMQATALSVLDGISDALARQLDPESALGETLTECLDAAGLSVGAVLLKDLKDAGSRLVMRAQVGLADPAAWEAHSEVFNKAMEEQGLILPSPKAGEAGARLLAMTDTASALVVPIVARDEVLGVLVLASDRADLSGDDGESFARTARSVSMQLGQALALSRTFSRLVAAEQRYRGLLENAPDAIAVLDEGGSLRAVNRAWEGMLGIDRDQMLGHPISEFVAQEAGFEGSDYSMAPAPGSAGLPTPIRHIDGRIVHVEFSKTTLEVGGEKLVLMIGRDVSERVRLAEQLRQTQKMEAIGLLAGGVAHDFNNVLSVILSYGELLLADLKPEDPMRADIEEIRKAGVRAADLTRQLLMFSRQQVVDPEVLELNDVIVGLDKMLRRMLGEDVEWESVLASPLGRIRADRGSIEQAIMNLVVNARDAMPHGGKLSIETADVVFDEQFVRGHLGVKLGAYVMLCVSDTGVGMDKDTQTHIFEPFFTTKDKGKGTGLGLSTVFGIVQQSGGTIWVSSEPGRGTTFKIYLPTVDAAVVETRSAMPAPFLRGSETILLVEDEDQVRNVARGILRRHGYHVVEARNAGEALLLCEKVSGPIHLLLSDVVMPHMSGPDLAKRLGSIKPQMRVLCMSGYTGESAIQGIVESGIAYLQKPITVESLTRKVREVLDAQP